MTFAFLKANATLAPPPMTFAFQISNATFAFITNMSLVFQAVDMSLAFLRYTSLAFHLPELRKINLIRILNSWIKRIPLQLLLWT
jgi:hypothetical protein